MRARHLAVLPTALLPLLLGACSAAPFGAPDMARTCGSDLECGPHQLCFPDGCGDPGSNLAVEVTPNARAGQHAQDFLVPELKPVQDFELYPGAFISGDVRQASADGGTPVVYPDAVNVRVMGESLLIPGLIRRFEALVTSGDGHYALPVASGHYTVVLTPSDTALPPQVRPGVLVPPGGQLAVDFTLPTPSTLLAVSGELVEVRDVLLNADMEVQALARDTQQPLSQPAPVLRDVGSFQLSVAREALAAQTYFIRATPRAPTTSPSPSTSAPTPTKLFEVPSQEPLPLLLEMGPFGAPVVVSGRVLDGTQMPLSGAVVYTRGEVLGGGTYQSESVLTDAEGRFLLSTLPSAAAGSTLLWVVPPPRSAWGVLPTPVTVSALAPDLGDFVAPAKVVVEGQVELPTGLPARGVTVNAVPLGAVQGFPPPAAGATAITDPDGQLQLLLDPGEYRLDFAPVADLPRSSQLLTVPASSAAPGTPSLVLPPTRLRQGLTVQGNVRVTSRTSPTDGVASFATVRFYRLSEPGRPPLLLAETVTDTAGNYAVVLPTR